MRVNCDQVRDPAAAARSDRERSGRLPGDPHQLFSPLPAHRRLSLRLLRLVGRHGHGLLRLHCRQVMYM